MRLLLSAARHGELDFAQENIDIAIEYFQKSKAEGKEPIVCGVELGGVTTAGSWEAFRPMFQQARDAGLPIALHCGENKQNQAEPREMMAFGPERLGHCVYLDDANMQRLLESGIPVETCLTCHDLCFSVPYPENVFAKLHKKGKVCLATDNPSFYQTSLSDEYIRCCEHHDVTIADVFALARDAIDFAFTSEETKASLRHRFDAAVDKLKQSYNLTD